MTDKAKSEVATGELNLDLAKLLGFSALDGAPETADEMTVAMATLHNKIGETPPGDVT